MSFISNLRTFVPRVTRSLALLAVGGNPAQRPVRISLTIAVVLILGAAAALSASGSVFASGYNDSPSVGLQDSVSVTASPSVLLAGDSVKLTASITHSFPNAKITVTITVTCPAGSGTPVSKTVTITTDEAGNGHASIRYPFATGGGENDDEGSDHGTRSVPGTCTVKAVFVLIYPIGTATTTFTVVSVSIVASPSEVRRGSSTTLTASVKGAPPNTKITVAITVEQGDEESSSKTVTITTNSEGNGHVSVVYPSQFPGGSTTEPDTYDVTATFVISGTPVTATTEFTVHSSEPESE